MECVNTDGFFITIDVGVYGRNTNGRVFRRCSFEIDIENNSLDIFEPKLLPEWINKEKKLFVIDEAFPLKVNIM